jgi:hypothetical protein
MQPHYSPGQALRFPGGCGSQISRQSDRGGRQVVSPKHWPLLTPENIPVIHFCYRLSRPQGHSAAGRNMSVENSSDTNRNLNRDVPACSTTARPKVTYEELQVVKMWW